MKTKSVLFLLTGIAIGAIGNSIFTSAQGISKRRRELSKKSKQYNRAFKETASKYKEKLGAM